MGMGGGRGRGEVEVGMGVGRGGIGGILVARSGRIRDIDRGIDRFGGRRIGLERDIRIDESGLVAMRGEEMMIGLYVGPGSEVPPLDYRDGEAIREIDMTTDDEIIERAIVHELWT